MRAREKCEKYPLLSISKQLVFSSEALVTLCNIKLKLKQNTTHTRNTKTKNKKPHHYIVHRPNRNNL